MNSQVWRVPATVTAIAVIAVGTACSADPDPAPAPASAQDLEGDLRVEVLETFPHDPDAFTQGLELYDGLLYESTGRYGESDVRIVEPDTGEVRAQVDLPDDAFGEGLTLVDDRVWQLTWQEGYALVWDRDTLAELDRVPYDGEGWGLCYDPDQERLVMSDGSAELTFRDPETFDPVGSVTVTRDGEPLEMVNELECVAGQVWANVWLTDDIVRIDPDTGEVTAVVDASGLLTEQEAAEADVLNGIAVQPDGETFLITGKLWPTLFLVRFVPA